MPSFAADGIRDWNGISQHPDFLEGGVERWEAEVRGTEMEEEALQHERRVA